MKRLCFCLCTALGILLFVLKKPIGISVLGLCAVLFVLSVCVNIFSKKKLSATLVSDGTGLKNKDMSLKFIFTGTCGEYSGKLRLRNMLTGQCEDIKVHFIISTGLTWKKAQCEIEGSVNIMPDAAEIDESEEAKLKEALESDFFSNENEGFDHSEPIGIREYRQGDSYKSVHWKLSFRLGDIYVREYGEPVTDSLCIYVETGGNVPATDYDLIAAKALSLSMYLSDGGIGHYMAFYSFSQQRKVFEHIDSADSFTVALDSLLSSQPEQGKERLTEFSELFERSGISRVIEIK